LVVVEKKRCLIVTILVTGGTGFIGSHLVDTLVANGEQVKVLVRETSNVAHLKDLGVELVVGDLTDPECVDSAMKGSNYVCHLATAPDWSPKKEHWNTNYYGTLNMFESALKRGVQRFVYCSTAGVLGFADKVPLDENCSHLPSPYSPYAITKCEAEKEARAYYRKGLPVAIMRPAQVYGPRDSGTMGLGIKWVQRGFFPLIGGGKALLQPIYVQDVVDAIILAMEVDKALGQTYNIAGEEILSFKEFFSIITNTVDTNSRQLNLPRRVAWILGYLFEAKTRLFGGYAFLTRFRVECATRNMIYDISKAKEELGFTPKVGIEEGVHRTVQWFRKMASSDI
jgi:nucleoside-diphosphate-sugar epimerase